MNEAGRPIEPRELRMVLWDLLADRRVWTVDRMVAAVGRQGFVIGGSPPKRIADALRHHRRGGRVVRLAPGKYVLGELPRSTLHWYRTEALAARNRLRDSSNVGAAAGSGRG